MGRSWQRISIKESLILQVVYRNDHRQAWKGRRDTTQMGYILVTIYSVLPCKRVTLNTLKEPTMWVRQLLFPLYRWKHRKVIQSKVAKVTLLHREGHFSLLQNLLQTRGGKNYFLMPQLLLRTTHENLSTIKQKSIAWNCWDIITQNIIT